MGVLPGRRICPVVVYCPEGILRDYESCLDYRTWNRLWFRFGKLLQIVGIVAEIPFNMWNVMEYSIGFFGGIALAYSVFTSEWPGGGHRVGPWENRVSFVLLFLLIPFIVFQQSLTFHLIVERFTAAGEFERPELIGRISTMTALVILIVMALLTGLRLRRARNRFGASEVYFILSPT